MTTILFPLLTFTLVFILGIIFGIYISKHIEKKIETRIQKNIKAFFTYKDQNGNILKIPIQDHTMITPDLTLDDIRKSKIKLNKYEMTYLIQNIQKHLENIGETPEENEFVTELFKNLKKPNGNTKR